MSDVIELLKTLVAKPSITPNDHGCQEIIANRLNQLGFACEKFRFGEVDNLWARYGTKAPLIVFAGHTDVVPPGPESHWTSPPFTPTIRENALYGRGVTDMKGGCATMIIAVEKFIATHPSLTGSIAFLFTSDEEGPSIDGTKKVLDVLTARSEKIHYCIVGEPSSHEKTGDQVRIGRRGSLHAHLIVHGKQGHVAFPHLADNPIHNALLALHEITQTAWDKGNEQFPPTSCQMSNIHSGTGANNVIPGHMEIKFNFRFSTAITPDEIKSRTQAILDRHQLRYDIEWHTNALPFLTRPGNLLTATQDAITTVTGKPPLLSTAGGTSDARFFAMLGIEVIELGVPHKTAHQIDEQVKLEDLDILVKLYETLLEKLI